MVAERNAWDYLNWLALRPVALLDGHVWQVLTYQFLHDPDNILHLLLNTAMLWFFGRQVEGFLGRMAFLKLYLFCGVVGGLTQLLVSWSFAGQLQPELAVLGASAGVCGLIAAFAAIHWEQKLILWLFFIIPVPMRGKNVVLVLMGLCLLGAWIGGSNIAHAAHFGGIWMGLVYIRWIVQADRVLNAWEALRDRVRPRPFIEPVESPPPPFAAVDEFPPVTEHEPQTDHETLELMRAATESALDRFIRAAYGLLDLVSYFTVGADEVRAWTIRRGTRARQAAGVLAQRERMRGGRAAPRTKRPWISGSRCSTDASPSTPCPRTASGSVAVSSWRSAWRATGAKLRCHGSGAVPREPMS